MHAASRRMSDPPRLFVVLCQAFASACLRYTPAVAAPYAQPRVETFMQEVFI